MGTRLTEGSTLKITATELLARLDTAEGAAPRFLTALAHGSMSVELYAPRGDDAQQPHRQDELYFIHSGSGSLVISGERHEFSPGTCFFVPAGVEHRFEGFTEDFSTWVVFWGPDGGEK